MWCSWHEGLIDGTRRWPNSTVHARSKPASWRSRPARAFTSFVSSILSGPAGDVGGADREPARAAGVRKIVMLSFLRARPACGSPYHESKWAAEELVRKSGLDYTVVKASMTFGPGDHMLDHLSHLLYTLPVFVTVGLREKLVRPVAVQDVVQVLAAALIGGRLSRQTVAVLGPETLRLSEVAKRVGRLIGKHALVVPAPAAVNYVVAGVAERVMRIPLASLAQVRMLDEGLVEPWGNVDPLPEDLVPRTPLSDEVLRAGLPTAGPFTRADLRIPGVI